jgi:serine/threonine protein kinase
MGGKLGCKGPCNYDFVTKPSRSSKADYEPQCNYTDPDTAVGSKNAVVASDFALEKLTGKCATGAVFIVTYLPEETRYLMKVVSRVALRKATSVTRQMKDRGILTNCPSPFLIKRAFRLDLPDKIVEIVEYSPGIDMSQRLTITGKLSEYIVRFYAAEVLLGLEWLHSHEITYRELMPSSVLVDSDGHIKLSDFGISRFTGELTLTSTLPRLIYVAPEVLERDELGIPMDYWSLGVLVYELLAGRPPFKDESASKRSYLKTVKRSPVMMKNWFSPEASDFITKLLQLDVTPTQPSKRLSSAAEAKAHPFFNGVDWESLSRKEVMPPPGAGVRISEDSESRSVILGPEFEEMLSSGFAFKIDSTLLRSVRSS